MQPIGAGVTGKRVGAFLCDMNYIDYAEELSGEGFLVIPLLETKAPALPPGDYLYNQTPIDDRFTTAAKFGVVCGKASNGLEVVDFDCHDGQPIDEVFGAFIENEAVSQIISTYNLPIYQTPSGGKHLYFRSDYANGSTVLARWADGSVMIETRGHGAYVAAWPSPGYSQISGGELVKLESIDEQARTVLLNTARTFTRSEVTKSTTATGGKWPERFNDDSLIGHFNNEGVDHFRQALTDAGWTYNQTRRDGAELWVRPGKPVNGSAVSATFGALYNLWYVFSESQTTFQTRKAYTIFDAVRLLKFGGDFNKAAAWVAGLYPEFQKVEAEVCITEIAQDVEVPPFPIDFFPPQYQQLLKQVEKSQTFSLDLMAVGIMFTVACAAGNKFKLMVNETWQAPLIFWFAAMGKTGTKKSPPVATMVKPLSKINKAGFARYEDEHKQWEANEKKGKEPQPTQVYLEDYTLEALLKAHDHNKRGVGVYKDELKGFFGDMNKYRSKGSDEEFWLQSFNNSSYQVNRVTVRPMRVDSLCINLCGGIQPDVMSEIARTANNNGIIERFLYTSPVTTHEYNFRNTDDTNTAQWLSAYNASIMEIYHNFEYSDPEVDDVHVKMTPEAFDQMKRIDDRLTDIKKSEAESDRIIGYCSKLQTYSPRFALLSWVLRGCVADSYPQYVEPIDFRNAAKMVGYFLATAKKVYFDSEAKQEAKEIIGKLTGKARAEKVVELKNKGVTDQLIAEMLQISRVTVQKIKNENKDRIQK